MPQSAKPDRRPLPTEMGNRDSDEDPLRSKACLDPFRIALLFSLSAVAAVLLGAPWRLPAASYRPGDIAREDVKASRDFLVEDWQATEKRRQEAESRASAVYDYDPDALSEVLDRLAGDLEEVAALEQESAADSAQDHSVRVAKLLSQRWETEVMPGEASALLSASGRETLRREVRASLAGAYAKGVVANRGLLMSESGREAVLRNLATSEETPLSDWGAVLDFDETRRGLLEAVEAGSPGLARRVAGVLLRPNLSFNSVETSSRRAQARQAVKPVLYQIQRGEMIVREGERVSADQARRLAAHATLTREQGAWSLYFSLFGLSFAVLLTSWRFGVGNIKKFRGDRKDLAVIAALFVLMFLVERAGLFGLRSWGGLEPAGQSAAAYALPLAAAAIVLRVLLNSETALVAALPFYALAALPFEHHLVAFLLFGVGGLAGAHRASKASRRVDFLRAGLWAGLAQAFVALCCLPLIGEPGLIDLKMGVAALVGGTASGIAALCLVPLAEWSFGYTTDMRLMELASLDHPLLRRLMLRAPGTYHHSVVTGSLAKAAAETIGARALLAMVAAYYHDVGKISKPDYFIENQGGEKNRHDKLTPSMSSLILMSHVKEGVELARKHRLGREITDIIQQHHGTSLMRFFYDRARERSGPDGVRESDYRYPGPKPQTREAALILLADAVEAATRSLPDPKPARIQGLVQNIVNRTFSDGQLDHCDLTLKDLHEIARRFTGILCAIHHQRIDYPLAAHKEKRPDGDLDTERLRGPRRREAQEAGEEGLKRLGM